MNLPSTVQPKIQFAGHLDDRHLTVSRMHVRDAGRPRHCLHVDADQTVSGRESRFRRFVRDKVVGELVSTAIFLRHSQTQTASFSRMRPRSSGAISSVRNNSGCSRATRSLGMAANSIPGRVRRARLHVDAQSASRNTLESIAKVQVPVSAFFRVAGRVVVVTIEQVLHAGLS